MNDLMQIVENEQTSEFYPTPESVVKKMIEDINFDRVKTILEPSAGKGDILRLLAKKEKERIYSKREFDVDCIEIDANLRQVLKYNFSERKNELHKKQKEITAKYKHCEKRYGVGWSYYDNGYVSVPDNDKEKLESLDEELDCFFSDGIHIVHDDFLNYEPFKTYDLIIMNPPFSNGDRHLLKALKIQEKGGNIICLLNAETIRNPYTDTRRELLKQLNKYNAQIEFINNAFTEAERKTGVEIALVKVAIEDVQEESEIYKRMKEAEKFEEIDTECTEIAVTDLIKALVSQYNVEAKTGIELIRQYKAAIPYISCGFGDDIYERAPVLQLKVGDEDLSINRFLKRVRLKYWRALLSNPKFVGKLTSKLQKEYRKKVERLSDYDFSEFNIYTLSAEMNAQIKTGIEAEIIAMFDLLTAEHSWYPETKNNRHYYDGWATNKAHMIGKKVIIPCYGIFSSYDGTPRTYNARGALEDIERILNFLDGGMTRDVDLWQQLEHHFNRGITKNIELKYFKATFYKKGTIHLVFTCPELIERFNIYAAQNKQWLPPCYGKKAYTDMTKEEKAVVDSFQGEEAYNEVIQKSNYFLSPVTNNQMLMLGE